MEPVWSDLELKKKSTWFRTMATHPPVQTQHEERVAVTADALKGANQTQTCDLADAALFGVEQSSAYVCLAQTVASD
jgi:hypothetical protein